MSALLCIVADVFQLPGRGCIVTPGAAADLNPLPRAGDPVVLKRPDGSELATTIRGLDRFGGPPGGGIPILLAGVEKADIPIGTEVWLVQP
jgi:hypothetical protein